jgi:hypothetical protein
MKWLMDVELEVLEGALVIWIGQVNAKTGTATD